MGALSLFKILLAILVLHAICCGQECDPNGINCINCTDYRVCSGGAPNGPIFSCKNGARCGEKPLLEHCWIKLNCYALNECSEVGIFPDAMVESNYFVCLPDSGSGFIKYDFTCPEGEFFDQNARICLASAATLDTTLSPNLETTTAVQTAETTTKTQTSVTPTSASTSSPTLETTTATQTPAGTTATASTSSPTPETTTQTPASPTPETTTAIPTIAPTSPPSLFNCTAPGIFPNPINCKMYFRCSTSLKVFHYICPGTSYFNENILKCSLIITPACQQQILQNTTTSTTPVAITSTTTRTAVPTPSSTITTTAVPTSSPSTTTAAVPTTSTITTTTPAPETAITTTSPIQAPTTTIVPSTPFACSTAGTFENPLDCKTYYRCSSSGKTFLYVCPNGSYYNESTKRCGLTITPRCRSKLSE